MNIVDAIFMVVTLMATATTAIVSLRESNRTTTAARPKPAVGLANALVKSRPSAEFCAKCANAFRHSLAMIIDGGSNIGAGGGSGNKRGNNNVSSSSGAHSISTDDAAKSLLKQLAPFHAVLMHTENVMVARRRIEWICFSSQKYRTCLQKCPNTRRKLLDEANVEHWTSICQLAEKQPQSFYEFLLCEKKHTMTILNSCPAPDFGFLSEGDTPPQQLRPFCRAMWLYARCYVEVPLLECTVNATKISDGISRSLLAFFDGLLQLSREHLRLPDACHAAIALFRRRDRNTPKKETSPPAPSKSSSMVVVSSSSNSIEKADEDSLRDHKQPSFLGGISKEEETDEGWRVWKKMLGKNKNHSRVTDNAPMRTNNAATSIKKAKIIRIKLLLITSFFVFIPALFCCLKFQ